MITEKKLKYKGYTLFVWDWFEATKYLNILAGSMIGVMGFGLYWMKQGKILGGVIIVVSLVVVFVLGAMVNFIRSENLGRDCVNIKVNGK